MNQFPDHGINDPDVRREDEYDMPCVQALIAGTLALMTGHAQTACAQHRALMAAKTASNLFILSQHPVVSPGFKTVAWRLHGQWVEQVQAECACVAPAQAVESQTDNEQTRALWHKTAEGVQ